MTRNEEMKYKQFEDLINRYRKLVRKLCWRNSSGSVSQCEELVQDCYISIWCHLPSLRPDAHTCQQTAWVVLQCRSVFSHRRRSKPPDWLPIDQQMAETIPAPDDSSHRELIEEYAADLAPNERNLLDLILEGYGQKEIAEKLKMSIEAVKKMRQRLIKKMQKTKNNNNDDRTKNETNARL